MRVLLVDDSMFMRNFLKGILLGEWSDIEIDEAGDGEEALDKFHKFRPDLVLLDIIIPKKDGLEVLREVAKYSTVVVISAVGQEKVIEQARMLGAQDFIVKPFEVKKIIQTLRPILDKPIKFSQGSYE